MRTAGLRVGLYYSPLSWRYPGYYDVRGTNCLPNKWGYFTDPAHKENARIMKNEVYQQVKELVTQYGKIDDLWWDGGWLGQTGTDADAAFFWEPGKFRDPSNEWPVDSAYSETDSATGKPLGLTGLVRKHQADIVTRTGAVPADQAAAVRKVGSFLSTCGQAVYGTRGGPWEPVEGQYGYTSKDNIFYIHLLPGYNGTSFTTSSIGDAQVTRVFDVATGANLPYAVGSDGRVTITGVNRTRTPEDSIVGVTLDRPVQPTYIAASKTATSSSEETSKGNTAAKAVDGSTATRWCANNGDTGQWLEVDLMSERSLTGTRIAWEFAATNYRYGIEGSTDNASWTTLADLTATTSTSQVQVSVFRAQARYVRVTVTGLPSGAWASIRSLEVYDRPLSADAGTF